MKLEIILKNNEVMLDFLRVLEPTRDAEVQKIRDEACDMAIKSGLLLKGRWTKRKEAIARGTLVSYHKHIKILADKAASFGVDVTGIHAKSDAVIDAIRKVDDERKEIKPS